MWILSNGKVVTKMSYGNYCDFIMVIREEAGSAKIFFFFFSSTNHKLCFVMISFVVYLCLWTIRVTLVESKSANLWWLSYFRWEKFNLVKESERATTSQKE